MLERLRERLGGHLPEWLRLVRSDGEPAALIEAWRGMELAIVVDAVRADPAVPGRTHRLELDRGDQAGMSRAVSSHGLGVGEAIGLARALDLLPGRLLVRAIEAGDTSFGIGMNDAVTTATDAVASAILGDLKIGPRAG